MPTADTVDIPAILGGTPVRPSGPPLWPPRDPAIDAVFEAMALDGSWGRYLGPHVERLTERLATAFGCEEVLLCSSGTAAVELALRGVKVGPGDEVILAAYDFRGNIGDILNLGARPVLVDVHPQTWNLDPERVAAAIGPKTKAILVSHLHGATVPMPRVMEIAATHGVPVVEDACQMPGARISGRPAGMWGDAGVVSFGGSKLLSAGRGGAVYTNRKEIAQRIRLFTQRGNEAYPLSEMQAAVLLPQVEQLKARNRTRAARVERLDVLLGSRAGLVRLRPLETDSRPGFYKVGYQYDAEAFDGLPRDLFSAAMRAEGVALDPGFRAFHRTHTASRFRAAGDLEHASDADARVLTLHHPVLLEEESALEEIVAALDKIRCHATMIREHERYTPTE